MSKHVSPRVTSQERGASTVQYADSRMLSLSMK